MKSSHSEISFIEASWPGVGFVISLYIFFVVTSRSWEMLWNTPHFTSADTPPGDYTNLLEVIGWFLRSLDQDKSTMTSVERLFATTQRIFKDNRCSNRMDIVQVLNWWSLENMVLPLDWSVLLRSYPGPARKPILLSQPLPLLPGDCPFPLKLLRCWNDFLPIWSVLLIAAGRLFIGKSLATGFCGVSGGGAACHSTLIVLSLLSFSPLCHSSKDKSAGPRLTLITKLIRWYFLPLFHQCRFFSLNIESGTLAKSDSTLHIDRHAGSC